jgi:hypothetical protein
MDERKEGLKGRKEERKKDLEREKLKCRED